MMRYARERSEPAPSGDQCRRPRDQERPTEDQDLDEPGRDEGPDPGALPRLAEQDEHHAERGAGHDGEGQLPTGDARRGDDLLVPATPGDQDDGDDGGHRAQQRRR